MYKFRRRAGLLLHPSSLPSPYGIGDLGTTAYQWVDLCSRYDQTIWQIFPLGPVGYGYSPYDSLSSFAGNPLLISPEKLIEEGLLSQADVVDYLPLSLETIDYSKVVYEKETLYRKAFQRFKSTTQFEHFCHREQYWLEDYSLFMTIKRMKPNEPWYQWEQGLRQRDPKMLSRIVIDHEQELLYHKFLQFTFSNQWHALAAYARKKRVEILGDVPYYTALDSCDVWASPDIFELDDQQQAQRVGGVPPDYFSDVGQLWGNPIYRWDILAKTGYSWWIKRIKRILEFVDWLRIDHFRAFESFWAVAAGSPNAIQGQWIKGPGKAFFDVLATQIPNVPLVAEDLGIITPDVELLRKTVGLPGMRVLQFSFDGGSDNPHRTFNIPFDSIAYTGTHDNPTLVGWISSLGQQQKEYICSYLGCQQHEIAETIIRFSYCSTANWCILPLQDVLQLGANHRMNTPGTIENNWLWRFTEDMIDLKKFDYIKKLTHLYGREAR